MAKRGPRRKYKTAQELRDRVEEYFARCEEQGVFPDYAGMKLHLGILDDRVLESYTEGSSDFARACREIFAGAAVRRESWLVRKMTSDNKSTQGCLNALKQPQNGGYLDRPQEGQVKFTICLAGVGGESAFK